MTTHNCNPECAPCKAGRFAANNAAPMVDRVEVRADRGVVFVASFLAVAFAIAAAGVGAIATAALARNGDLLEQLDSARWAGNTCELDRIAEVTRRAEDTAELMRSGPADPIKRCWVVKRTREAEVLACELGY